MIKVTEYLDISAQKYPNKVAFGSKNRNITFSELRDEALHIAYSLISKGLYKQPIAVYMDRDIECIVSFIGIAYSGNFYSPIDISLPEERINKILSTLEPKAVILKGDGIGKKSFADDLCVYYDSSQNCQIDETVIKDISKKIIDTDVLYVLFTSGSTGIPKGVIVSHRAVIDYTEWVTKTFEIDENHVFGNQAPFYFDNSILDIYQTIKNGATTYIIPKEMFAFPMSVIRYVEEKNINILFWVPSALCLLANSKAIEKKVLNNLKKVLFCGEVMPNKQLNQWRKVYPSVLFANLYGPTEITDVCCYYIVDRVFDDAESLPIGKACENTDIIILNEDDELAEVGEIGELCVRGTCLAYGYYKDFSKTREVFVQNPLNNEYYETIYRTGDMVHLNELGEILFDNRKDNQIKLNGHRIELGEIETLASSYGNVDACCCYYNEKKKQIILFYSGDEKKEAIIEHLKMCLPNYMIPSAYLWIKDMPLNLNGKIDRVLLKQQYEEGRFNEKK